MSCEMIKISIILDCIRSRYSTWEAIQYTIYKKKNLYLFQFNVAINEFMKHLFCDDHCA